MIGVSLDKEDAAPVKKFAERQRINYPVILGDRTTAAADNDVEVLPTTFLINRAGKVVKVHRTLIGRATLEAEIVPLL